MAKKPAGKVEAASKARAERLREQISGLIAGAGPQNTRVAGGAKLSPREFIQQRMAQLGGMPKPAARKAGPKKAGARKK